jgi:hypothetical protein
MDAKHARDVETLSRDLESALSKLRSYEILEEEIDDAVIRKAQHLASGIRSYSHSHIRSLTLSVTRMSDHHNTQVLMKAAVAMRH